MKLLIVESPTKARTITRFLNSKEYEVTSSMGHVRDLPAKKMGVDVAHDFQPEYVTSDDKQKIVATLKKQAKKAETVIFATDEDREGEAIAWHLVQALGLAGSNAQTTAAKQAPNIARVVFHEVTEDAILEALGSPRQIDMQLVDAQQARRVLDRLVGYELSPFLWKKVAQGLSAGRVQSAAVRLIAEKEDEIRKFKADEYWTIEAIFSTDLDTGKLKAKIIRKDTHTDDAAESLQKLKDGEFTGKLHSRQNETLDKFALKTEPQVAEILGVVENRPFRVASIKSKAVKRTPLPPFTTSTLQQAANRQFGFSAKQTMFLAQQLYEGVEIAGQGSQGLITYMRTDSVNLSSKFIEEARDYIEKKFGPGYLPSQAATYKTKSKGAQEAHEAIRPTQASLDPERLKSDLETRLFKLYKLIWQRALACQMNAAQLEATSVDIKNEIYVFRATGQMIKFPGFLQLDISSVKETTLPELKEQQALAARLLNGIQRFTQPPARYSEATLVKKLEELGIGRPSTYAPIISTIQARRYVDKDKRWLRPTAMGEVVNKVLVEHFPEVVDYNFTAKMEANLDEIAVGKKKWVPVMKEFYVPFKKHLEEKKQSVSKKDLEEATDEVCEKCGQPMVIKIGRFGKFLACSGFPKCKNTKPHNSNGNNSEADAEIEDLGACPDCGKPLIKRRSRFGEFIGCSGYPACKYIKKEKQKHEKTGIKCPKCEKGELISKRTRRGKIFYACSRYPDCDQAYWNKPTGDKCEHCASMITETPKGLGKCENKVCPGQAKKKKENS